MVQDALDPGPKGDYPYWPRDKQGRPINSQAEAEAAGKGTYMPKGTEVSSERDALGDRLLLDLTPRKPDGTPITPPVINP